MTHENTASIAADLRARLARSARDLDTIPDDRSARIEVEKAEMAIRYFECNACSEQQARCDVDIACDAVNRAVNAARAA